MASALRGETTATATTLLPGSATSPGRRSWRRHLPGPRRGCRAGSWRSRSARSCSSRPRPSRVSFSPRPCRVANPRDSSPGPPSPRRRRRSEQVTVDPASYVGLPVDEASQDLRDDELTPVTETRSNPGDQEAGTVAEVSPVGQVDAGTEVTLTVWGEPPATGSDDNQGEGTSDEPGNNGNGNGNGNSGNGNGNSGSSGSDESGRG